LVLWAYFIPQKQISSQALAQISSSMEEDSETAISISSPEGKNTIL